MWYFFVLTTFWHNVQFQTISGFEINFFAQLATNWKILVANLLYKKLTKKMILCITLHARKVTIEERKQLETTRVTPGYKATLVLRWYVSGLKSVVFIETNTGPCVFSPCYTIFKLPFFIFALLFSMPFAANKCHAWPRPLHNHIAHTSLRPGEEATETIWRVINIVSMCQNTFNFFDSLVIDRCYFTGDGKVSCILATISDWFPNKKI